MAGFEHALKAKRDADSMQNELSKLMDWSLQQKKRDENIKSDPKKAAKDRNKSADAAVSRSIDAFAASPLKAAADCVKTKTGGPKQSRSEFILFQKPGGIKGKKGKSVSTAAVSDKEGAEVSATPSQPSTPEIKREAKSPPKPDAAEQRSVSGSAAHTAAAAGPDADDNTILADKLRECGNTNFRKGNFEEARAAYSASLEACPGALALANRAMVNLKQQQWAMAEADATAALAFNAAYSKAWQRRAAARLKIGGLQKVLGAVEDLEQAVRLQPDSAALAAERAAAVASYHKLAGAASRPSSHIPIRIVDSRFEASPSATVPHSLPPTITQTTGVAAPSLRNNFPGGTSAEAPSYKLDHLSQTVYADGSLRTPQKPQQQQQQQARGQQDAPISPALESPQPLPSQNAKSAPPQSLSPDESHSPLTVQQPPQQFLRGCQIEEIEDDAKEHLSHRASSATRPALDSRNLQNSGPAPHPAGGNQSPPSPTSLAVAVTATAAHLLSDTATGHPSNTDKTVSSQDCGLPSCEDANAAAGHLTAELAGAVSPKTPTEALPAGIVVDQAAAATASTAATSKAQPGPSNKKPPAAAAQADGVERSSSAPSAADGCAVSGSVTSAALVNTRSRPATEQTFSPAATLAASLTRLTPPRTGADFERSWRMLTGQPERQADYLRMISPVALPLLLRTQLTAQLLEALLPPLLVAAATAAASPSAASHAMKMLSVLPDVPRFVLAAMSVPPSRRRVLSDLWDAALAQISQQEAPNTHAADAKQLLCLLKPIFLL